MRSYAINRITIAILFCAIGSFLFYKYDVYSVKVKEKQSGICDDNLESHRHIVESYFEKRKDWRTSNLGSVLFKNINTDVFLHSTRENKTFVVLFWKHDEWFKKRRGTLRASDPLERCSVNNCVFLENSTYVDTADAVIVHMQRGLYPNVTNRNPNQKWIFLSDESPRHTFLLAKAKKSISKRLSELANVFNWTMTYRSDADIPVPYGRTVPLSAPIINNIEYDYQLLPDLVPNWKIKKQDVLASVLISNCVKFRMKFINDISKYIKVDIFGRCSNKYKNACPGHFRVDCKPISEYLFYLVIENSKCKQYITEKSFHNAYSKGAIPVIMGPSLEDCEKLLPPNSFLHVDNYRTTEELASHMVKISESFTSVLTYHSWRNHFKVVNDHGYFGGRPHHRCRACEALNYNDGEVSVYDEKRLRLFFDPDLTCRK